MISQHRNGEAAEQGSVLNEEDIARLDGLYEKLSSMARLAIGYPSNQRFDYTPLYRFLRFAANNVGDPFSGSNFPLNTHEFEREVITSLAPWTGIDPNDCWGYVTNGGTEGNMYGLYLAREIFPHGTVYFSEETHYSVSKILRLQHTPNIMIRSQPSGEMDYRDLAESIRIHPGVPPIIFANVGTTMKGAIDRLDRIREILQAQSVSNWYIHVDAAFSGMVLPFVDDPPPWHFGAGADSVSISGHKMIGSPLPCGVLLARKAHMERVARSVEYVGVLDTTISGSRNAITPLFLWYALRSRDEHSFRQMVTESLHKARYAVESLRSIGVNAWRNPYSATVVFPRPSSSVVRKWALAVHRDIAHLVTVPSISLDTIDTFVSDMQSTITAVP